MALDVGGVPMVYTGPDYGRGGYGYGCDGGGWMGMLLLIALLGGRGFGFGRDGIGFDGVGKGCGCCCEKEVEMMDHHVDARFNSLQNQVDFNATNAFQREILEKSCETDRNVDNRAFGLAHELGAIGMSLKDCCCETNRNVDQLRFNVTQEICGTNRNIDQLRFDMSKEFCATDHLIDKCCCETNRNIDSVKFQAERDKCEIIGAVNAGNQRIIDWLSCNELKEANARIAALEAEKNKLEIIGAMRPPMAVPAYAAANPYENFVPAVRCIERERREPFHGNCCFGQSCAG